MTDKSKHFEDDHLMYDFKETEMRPQSSPTVPTQRNGVKRYASPFSPSVVVSVVACAVAAVACIAFAVTFLRALRGFARQIGAFVSVGEWNPWFLQLLITSFALVFIAYLLCVHLASLHLLGGCFNGLGNSCVLFITSFGSQGFLFLWVLVLCGVCACSLVYFLFIGGIYSFCALVDQQCFDFKVLLPAIVKAVSNKKIDLVFCEEKKELLCNRDNNMIWNFGLAFVLGLVAFAGVLLVQNIVVYSFGKRQGSTPIRRAKNGKGETYEMTTME